MYSYMNMNYEEDAINQFKKIVQIYSKDNELVRKSKKHLEGFTKNGK